MTTRITIDDVIKQAACTAELTGDFTVDGLWDYAFCTAEACDEDDDRDFTIEQLESVFNELCDTARCLNTTPYAFIKETLQ